jgi:Mycothiol maleylpyruvate isomerase N-terminal domain
VATADDGWVVPGPGFVCAECGFDFDACVTAEMADTVRSFGRKYRAPLTRGLPGEDLDALLRTRSEAGGWSALEYAGHMRDVFLVNDYRIPKTLAEDRPSFRRVDPDQGAAERDYNGQDPAVVVDDLAAAAEALAAHLEAVPPDGWARIGVRDDFEMTVDWMGRNVIHEGTHHLLDIARTVRAARGR